MITVLDSIDNRIFSLQEVATTTRVRTIPEPAIMTATITVAEISVAETTVVVTTVAEEMTMVEAISEEATSKENCSHTTTPPIHTAFVFCLL